MHNQEDLLTDWKGCVREREESRINPGLGFMKKTEQSSHELRWRRRQDKDEKEHQVLVFDM